MLYNINYNGKNLNNKLSFIMGMMNSGKTSALINIWNQNSDPAIVYVIGNNKLDSRVIQSKREIKYSNIPSCNNEDIRGKEQQLILSTSLISYKKEISSGDFVILIDEGQFLSRESVTYLRYLVDTYKITIVVFGLKTDFIGNLFEGSEKLIAYSDSIINIESKCKCDSCNNNAIFNARLIYDKETSIYSIATDGEQIEEDKQIYLPLCYNHFISSIDNGLVPISDKELD